MSIRVYNFYINRNFSLSTSQVSNKERRMKIVLKIFALVIKLTNIILHGIGLYLLKCLPKRNRGKPQVIYIMNLSAIELILNAVSFLRRILKMTSSDISKADKYMQYTYIFDYSVLKFSLHLTMIAITLDRMFLIILNLQYPKYFKKKCAKLIVLGIWLLSGVMFITYILVFIYEFEQNPSKSCASGKFMLVAFDIMFVVIAIVAYYLIFKKHTFQQSQRSLLQLNNLTVDGSDEAASSLKQSFWNAFKHSRFYVALLLILTFIVFVIPPDMIFAFYECKNKEKIIKHVATISYAFSYFSDGVVYIFLNREVRRLLLNKVRRNFQCCFSKPVNKTQKVVSTPLMSKTRSKTSSL